MNNSTAKWAESSRVSSIYSVKRTASFLFFLLLISSQTCLFAEFETERAHMVQTDLMARGIKNSAVLEAMAHVDRHKFVPDDMKSLAYADHPLPIGEDQTISQPYIVALMTELLNVNLESKVLEIGTGSGYQAAVLGEIVKEVYTIEIIPSLAETAEEALRESGYENVFVKTGDGYLGWPEKGPFDAVIVTAAPEEIPQPLIDQLKVGGRMVIPVGSFPSQTLYLIKKNESGIEKEEIIPVRFVPMTGEAQTKTG